MVGFVKRQLRTYLEPQAQALLPRLETGERTPLFLVRTHRSAAVWSMSPWLPEALCWDSFVSSGWEKYPNTPSR